MEQVKKNEISFARFEPKVLRYIHVAKKDDDTHPFEGAAAKKCV
jgi:hypothetical protein